jgi:hypothetical protein
LTVSGVQFGTFLLKKPASGRHDMWNEELAAVVV